MNVDLELSEREKRVVDVATSPLAKFAVLNLVAVLIAGLVTGL